MTSRRAGALSCNMTVKSWTTEKKAAPALSTFDRPTNEYGDTRWYTNLCCAMMALADGSSLQIVPTRARTCPAAAALLSSRMCASSDSECSSTRPTTVSVSDRRTSACLRCMK